MHLNNKHISNPEGFTDLSKHNTSTDLVETAEGEVMLSLVLSASAGTSDAVIYYNADNMDFAYYIKPDEQGNPEFINVRFK